MGSQDEESNYGSDLQSFTTSLASKATEYKFVNGRRYHAYEEGRYVFPNDDKESDRLDIMHQMVTLALRGSLFSAPVKNPSRVLDIGTGTGIWAIEAGDMFPQADVLGNDLSPIQPRWVPPNVHFEVDDVEKPWTFSRPFDFIHCRGLYGAITDWPQLIQHCFENTAPGGYCEFTDWDPSLKSPDDSIAKNSSFSEFSRILLDHLENSGTTARPGPSLEGWIKNAGYQIIERRVIPLPIGMWPKDEKMKEIGAWNYIQTEEGLEGFATYILHVQKGWTKDEVDVFCAKVRAELKDRTMHSMATLYNVVGKKPE
jgi:SAM-dependent methyltransferase